MEAKLVNAIVLIGEKVEPSLLLDMTMCKIHNKIIKYYGNFEKKHV
jgi:hypothetical protein